MTEQISDAAAAIAFRRLVKHLQHRHDAENIDLMGLAGFCRNCLSKWYLAEAESRDLDLDYGAAREIVYGMPYDVWKRDFQPPATPRIRSKIRVCPTRTSDPLAMGFPPSVWTRGTFRSVRLVADYDSAKPTQYLGAVSGPARPLLQ